MNEFLGIEIFVYIYVLDSARVLFEHPVLQYKDIFASSQFDIGTVNVPPVEIEHDIVLMNYWY